MTAKSDYAAYLQRKERKKAELMGKYWVNQESRYISPFQIYGNLYYVGDSWVCAHIVDTGDGLILFDAGNTGATAMLIHAIWAAGFNPADVRWLILSHGHVEHIGAANFFKRMFDTKIYPGAPDAEMFRTKPKFVFIQDGASIEDELCLIDVEINDGDVLQFGHITVKFVLVPGHTEGCIACFFDVTDGDHTRRVGYYGGFGFNTLQKEFLEEYGDPQLTLRQQYLHSLEKVRNEPVDIFMANHTVNIDLLAKRQQMLADPGVNPFIDKKAWSLYLDKKRDDLLKMMED